MDDTWTYLNKRLVELTGVELYAVSTSSLNVRSGPGVTYSVIGGLVTGQRVRVLERQDGWARIELPSGWCSETYLRYE